MNSIDPGECVCTFSISFHRNRNINMLWQARAAGSQLEIHRSRNHGLNFQGMNVVHIAHTLGMQTQYSYMHTIQN